MANGKSRLHRIPMVVASGASYLYKRRERLSAIGGFLRCVDAQEARQFVRTGLGQRHAKGKSRRECHAVRKRTRERVLATGHSILS
jgi:hypothetical protein